MTAIRLIDPDSIVVQKVLDEWRLSERQRGRTLKLARADEIKVLNSEAIRKCCTNLLRGAYICPIRVHLIAGVDGARL